MNELEDKLEDTLDQIEQEDAVLDEDLGEEDSKLSEVEERARLMGWVPKEEFRGDESRWTDAESFVETAETRMPVMKENYLRLEQKYKTLEETVKAQREYQKEMGQRQYERAKRELEARQKEAVENADTEAFEAIKKEESELEEVYSPKESKPVQTEPEEVQQWKAANPWYVQNPQLQQAATVIEQQILNEEALAQMEDPLATPMSLGERLNEVSKRVREKYGKKRPTPPKTQGTDRQAAPSKTKKTWNDIPKEDREKGQQWIKAGVISQAEYVKDYFGE